MKPQTKLKLLEHKLNQVNKYCIPENINYTELLKTKNSYLKAIQKLKKK